MICVAIGLFLGQINIGSDFPFQENTPYGERGAVFFNTLAIVRPIRRVLVENRAVKSRFGNPNYTVIVEEVRVIASSPKLETIVRLVIPIMGDRSSAATRGYPLRTEKTYFMMLFRDPQGRLALPDDRLGGPTVAEPEAIFDIERKSANEIGAVAAFETRVNKITELAQPAAKLDRLLVNIANCLQGADVGNAVRVCEYLLMAEVGHQPWPKVSSDAPYFKSMIAAALNLAPHSQAHVYEVLVSWRVDEAQRLFYKAIKGCINDPKAFQVGGQLTFTLSHEVVQEGARTVLERQAKEMELFDMALSAKSPSLHRFLFVNCFAVPDMDRQRKVLAMAVSANDELCALYLGRIAIWNEDQENVPKYVLVKPGKRSWVNRKELIEYWKNILGF